MAFFQAVILFHITGWKMPMGAMMTLYKIIIINVSGNTVLNSS